MTTVRRIAIVSLVLLGCVVPSHAGWFEISLNDEEYDLHGGIHLGRDPQAQFALGARYLDSNDSNGEIYSVIAGFASQSDAKDSKDMLLGAQFYGGDGDGEDVGAAAIGAMGSWAPEKWKGVFVGGWIFWAPDVLSSSDTEGIFDWSVKGGYRITPKMEVFLAYARLTVDIVNVGDVDISDSWRVGFAGRF